MKTINLFFDFEFTSLSPDAQPISLGIVSSELCGKCFDKNLKPDDDCENCSGEWHKGLNRKSFYAEFSDFDMNRCDDWVKENVVSKLKYNSELKHLNDVDEEMKGNLSFKRDTIKIKNYLSAWLSQFSDFDIKFVCDCGTFDWYWMLQLIGEWEVKKEFCFSMEDQINKNIYQRHEEELRTFRKAGNRELIQEHQNSPITFSKKPGVVSASISSHTPVYILTKVGLPKLPANISPVPQDLNDLIALKQGVSVREAFGLDRECLNLFVLGMDHLGSKWHVLPHQQFGGTDKLKHNSLYDAKVIKSIYEKLMTSKTLNSLKTLS